jgi:hypothetical protein
MTAEGDGFALRVTAIWITAIAGLEIDKREMARIDFGTAQFDRLRGF